jgi:hypothetical protein
MMTFTSDPSRLIPVVIELVVRGRGGRDVGPRNRRIGLRVDSNFEICINNKIVTNPVLSEIMEILKEQFILKI